MKTLPQTQRFLWLGFGGLLFLLAFTGLTALSVLRKIEVRSQTIREDYLNRSQILEQLRSDIYLSGTYVRDLLLEQNPARADTHRQELQEAQKRIGTNIAAYSRILRGEERKAFVEFTKEVKSYFDLLKPALQWNAEERRRFGYAFMKDSLLPRRMTIVHLADQIASVNRNQMETGNQQIVALFSSFRKSLIFLLALTLLCGSLLAARSFHRIVRLEQLSATRFEDVEQARSALRQLSARLIAVQESDRRALSRELHDEIGQSLSALLLGIGNVAAILSPDSNAEARAQLSELRRLAEKTVAEVRDMSLLLRPSMLDDLGLIPAVQWQAREVSRNNNIFVHVNAESVPEDLPEEYRTCIYRIVQEALRNVVRHGNARSVHVRLHYGGDRLFLTVQDDGHGFAPEREKGLGILGMEERVTRLQGSFRIDSIVGAGTSIRVELPFSQANAMAEASL